MINELNSSSIVSNETADVNEYKDKPYTSAPKMAQLNEYDLTDIPLDVKSNSEFQDDPNNHVMESNIRENPSEIYFVKESNTRDMRMTLPSVEDGLSSGSELSCTDEIVDIQDNFMRSRNDSNKQEDIILNKIMIRDLTKDIEDLRKTITNAKSSLDDPITAPSNRPQHVSRRDHVQDNLSQSLSSSLNLKQQQQLQKPTQQSYLSQHSFPHDNSLPSSSSSSSTNPHPANNNVVADSSHFSHNNDNGARGGVVKHNKEYESDEDTDKLLTKPYETNQKIDIPELKADKQLECERKRKGKEVAVRHPDQPSALIEGVIFRANYLGSTQLNQSDTSGTRNSRDSRMLQAQEVVGRVKAPDSESQPSVAVELFISTEKILILNTGLSQIMMDHSLKSISYIADIGNILVLMARRINIHPPTDSATTPNPESEPSQSTNNENGAESAMNNQNKIICHVFESEEAQLIAQTIGNAFQVAYIEFLKKNGIDNPKLLKEVDYQDVLNDQAAIVGDELRMFSSTEQQKQVIIPKQKGECLGVVIVESGWGSMIPTVVLANMNPMGPAARCGLLNIGNQIISVNGTSLVGLPLSNCQQIIKKCKSQTAVKLVIVSCPPVVEVQIRRPDPKYQLGFSVQNGVICSLLRGGIAERGGVRVGHHIIEINGISVVAMSHERIVNLLATSYGEIHLRTMPSSIFRLLTGQENPNYI